MATIKGALVLLFGTTSVLFAQVKNVTVGVLPGRTEGFAIGSHIDHKTPAAITAFVSGALFTSLDSGATWTPGTIPNSQEGQGMHMATDSKGNLYYFYSAKGETGETEGFFSTSTDHGTKWNEARSFGVSQASSSAFALGNHPKKDGLMLAWTKTSEAEGAECQSNVFITFSGGKKWGEAVKLNKEPGLCDDQGGMLVASQPLVSKDGRVFVMWAGKEKIFLDRSYDGGKMWINTDLSIAEQKGGWKLAIPGSAQAGPAFSVAIDNTDTRLAGIMYLIYADQKNGVTDTDVWLLRTPNFGDNWTHPFRINMDEPGAHQYSPKIAVDQASNFVYIGYFDRRVNDGNTTDVYLAYSSDGGGAFKEKKINEASFNPDGTTPELLTLTAHKGLINIIWTTTESGQTTVRSATFKHSLLEPESEPAPKKEKK